MISSCFKNISKGTIIFFLSVMGIMSTTSSKEICLSCHTGVAYTNVYDSTAHGRKGVQCVECHVEKKSVLRTLWDSFVNLITFSYKNAHIAQRPTTETCLSCHCAINKFNIVAEDALPDSIKTIGLVISHDKHYERRDSCNTCHQPGNFTDNEVIALVSYDDPSGCVSCHQNISHVKEDKYTRHIPMEKECVICHNAKNKCPAMKNICDIKDSECCTECHPNQYSF